MQRDPPAARRRVLISVPRSVVHHHFCRYLPNSDKSQCIVKASNYNVNNKGPYELKTCSRATDGSGNVIPKEQEKIWYDNNCSDVNLSENFTLQNETHKCSKQE